MELYEFGMLQAEAIKSINSSWLQFCNDRFIIRDVPLKLWIKNGFLRISHEVGCVKDWSLLHKWAYLSTVRNVSERI